MEKQYEIVTMCLSYFVGLFIILNFCADDFFVDSNLLTLILRYVYLIIASSFLGFISFILMHLAYFVIEYRNLNFKIVLILLCLISIFIVFSFKNQGILL